MGLPMLIQHPPTLARKAMSKLLDQAVKIQASITQLPPDKRQYYQSVFNRLEEELLVPLILLQDKIDQEYPDLEPLSLK